VNSRRSLHEPWLRRISGVIAVDWEYDESSNRYSVVFTVEEGPKHCFAQTTSTVPGLDPASPNKYHHQARSYVRLRRDRAHHRGDVARVVAERLLVAQVRPRGDRNYLDNTISVTYSSTRGRGSTSSASRSTATPRPRLRDPP
jgi:outer membrane protein insertion porin family